MAVSAQDFLRAPEEAVGIRLMSEPCQSQRNHRSFGGVGSVSCRRAAGHCATSRLRLSLPAFGEELLERWQADAPQTDRPC